MEEKLRNIITQHGLDILDDEGKFEAVLGDSLADYDKKGIFVIKTALREGLVHDIKNNGEARLPVCVRKLVEENGFCEDIALWAVQVWYYALTSVSADSYIQKLEEHNKPVPCVQIGSQIWMAKNLNTGRFRNGDIIPEAKTDKEWERAGREGKPAWCYYDNDPENGKKYGRLYNWYAVNDPRGLAPEGWHIPTKAELETLASSAGNNSNALKASGQGTGTNATGFSALLAGYRDYGGYFGSLARYTNYWSSTVYDASDAYYMHLNYDDSGISRGSFYRSFGFSIRCVED